MGGQELHTARSVAVVHTAANALITVWVAYVGVVSSTTQMAPLAVLLAFPHTLPQHPHPTPHPPAQHPGMTSLVHPPTGRPLVSASSSVLSCFHTESNRTGGVLPRPKQPPPTPVHPFKTPCPRHLCPLIPHGTVECLFVGFF